MLSLLVPFLFSFCSSSEAAMIPEPKETSASLHYLVHKPAKTGVKHKAIILLHGVGSNERDLFALASRLPEDFYVISPRGPITLGAGSYAWYEVDFSSGKPVFNHAQEEQSRKLLIEFIGQMKTAYGIDEMYVGGFSQGAIMSYSIGLTHPELVEGIIALSGRILNEIRPIVRPVGELSGLRVMIAHGTADGTLPVNYAREAKDYLQKLSLKLYYHEYPIGHQISEQVIQDMNRFLGK
jgi:phospholipase/carboxylesterase